MATIVRTFRDGQLYDTQTIVRDADVSDFKNKLKSKLRDYSVAFETHKKSSKWDIFPRDSR